MTPTKERLIRVHQMIGDHPQDDQYKAKAKELLTEGLKHRAAGNADAARSCALVALGQFAAYEFTQMIRRRA